MRMQAAGNSSEILLNEEILGEFSLSGEVLDHKPRQRDREQDEYPKKWMQ